MPRATPAATPDAAPAAAEVVPSGDPGVVRVMSFNIRYGTAPDGPDAWPRRRDRLVATIRAFAPDLLATQECLADQAAFLREALPGHGFAGVGRDDGRQAGEMCALFWREAAFARLEEGHLWLSLTPEVPGSRGWDAALPRIASWVRLCARDDTTRQVLFVGTHFDHVGVQARRESARLLRARLLALARGVPVILAGDFNAPADAGEGQPYEVLAAADGRFSLIDTYRALHPPGAGEGTYHAFAGGTEGDRIDWILVSPPLFPREAAIVRDPREGRWPSDHFPVTAVLAWRGPEE